MTFITNDMIFICLSYRRSPTISDRAMRLMRITPLPDQCLTPAIHKSCANDGSGRGGSRFSLSCSMELPAK